MIHTVGPRYNAKYRTAAESALYNCYRNVLQIVRQVMLPFRVALTSHVTVGSEKYCL